MRRNPRAGAPRERRLQARRLHRRRAARHPSRDARGAAAHRRLRRRRRGARHLRRRRRRGRPRDAASCACRRTSSKTRSARRPRTVVLCGRDPANDIVLEAGRVGFTNFGEGIQVVDPYTGELRESTKQDVADCTPDHRRPARDRRRRARRRRPRRAARTRRRCTTPRRIFANTTKHASIGPLIGLLRRAR